MKEGEGNRHVANFLIDSESQLQAALGLSHLLHPEQERLRDERAQANVELTTEPSPPRKGSNAIRVKLADANGAPISGAEVSVTFFMPAMPAMGMAAMRTRSP